MKKILILIIIVIFPQKNILAQGPSKHEISFSISGGLSTLRYSGDFGSMKNCIGGSFGIGYNYYLSKQWSVGTGLELSLHNAQITLDDYSDSYSSNDGEYDFEFRTVVTNYKEKQEALFLNIPIHVHYLTPILKNHHFFVGSGFKFGIPVSGKYEILNASISNSGLYPIWSGEKDLILNTQEFMGFGNFERQNIKDDISLKIACLLSIETGIKWQLDKAFSFYTGGYFDFGLNDISKKGKKLIEYKIDESENFVNNSVVNTKVIGKAVPIAAGIKIRLSFNL
ncbi:outer membrane beta-barrel protein [Dysgonomonas sp. Marseille-P4677]|uniref:outer membrane beta-barrel protein n=1 Tax=Dysgonomonas sp. Marseille-P4677 TaxID=2364790 RepID=UPI001912D6DF|nr:outer membrane beta-barrel protein [Dysgonomonas sp. Marseille-P4677]MBK5720332.1 outer membrane beta-barrel protein [Dysgonomonas sp. Marseille-P4677]